MRGVGLERMKDTLKREERREDDGWSKGGSSGAKPFGLIEVGGMYIGIPMEDKSRNMVEGSHTVRLHIALTKVLILQKKTIYRHGPETKAYPQKPSG